MCAHFGNLKFPILVFRWSGNLIPSEPYQFWCAKIASELSHPNFWVFSQGKSNDWKEIWLELYLEDINCQSNVPNPRPELIYLQPEWKTRTKIHKVHPKWGLSRGRLMIPIRVYGSSDPSLNPSIGCQSVNWHFSSSLRYHFSLPKHRDNPIKLSRLVLLTIRTRRSLFLPTRPRYWYENIVPATRAKIAKITQLGSDRIPSGLYSWMILKSSALLSFTFPFWQIHWPYLYLYLYLYLSATVSRPILLEDLDLIWQFEASSASRT